MNAITCSNGTGAFDLFFQDVSDLFSNKLERNLWNDVRQQRRGSMDVRENQKEYIVEVDLPGFSEQDIDINIKDGVLTLSCTKNSNVERKNEVNNGDKNEKKQEFYLIKERSSFEVKRSLSFSDNIDEEAITANFENGVLEVRVPKREAKVSRQITVNFQKKVEN